MAELAVPLIALGSMYVISKQKDSVSNKNEGYTNMQGTKNQLPGINPPKPIKNFPTTEQVTRENNIGAYTNPNQHTDKYSNPTQNGASRNDLPGPNYSLTGKPIDKSNFKHNNMAPFLVEKYAEQL